MKAIGLPLLLLVLLSISIFLDNQLEVTGSEKRKMKKFPIEHNEEEWKKKLTPEQYHVLREAGTERPFSGKYHKGGEAGEYLCAGCGTKLFTSETKYDSHCGWPAFFQADSKETILEVKDESHGMVRTEVLCSKCGGHLGHVFNDGPAPTGIRYCINSVSLEFKESKKE
jgi:peptide-methionine (R)-S-oxide reductase